MSDDWKPGVRALCIKGGRFTRKGCVYTVADTRSDGELCGCGSLLWLGCVALLFEGHTEPDDMGCQRWASSTRFRKIRPHTPDAEDEETICLLNGVPEPVQ